MKKVIVDRRTYFIWQLTDTIDTWATDRNRMRHSRIYGFFYISWLLSIHHPSPKLRAFSIYFFGVVASTLFVDTSVWKVYAMGCLVPCRYANRPHGNGSFHSINSIIVEHISAIVWQPITNRVDNLCVYNCMRRSETYKKNLRFDGRHFRCEGWEIPHEYALPFTPLPLTLMVCVSYQPLIRTYLYSSILHTHTPTHCDCTRLRHETANAFVVLLTPTCSRRREQKDQLRNEIRCVQCATSHRW